MTPTTNRRIGSRRTVFGIAAALAAMTTFLPTAEVAMPTEAEPISSERATDPEQGAAENSQYPAATVLALPDALPAATTRVPYVYQFELPEGSQLRAADIPDWMDLDSIAGTLTGTPAWPGDATFSVILRDESDMNGRRTRWRSMLQRTLASLNEWTARTESSSTSSNRRS